ncbi:unnamed protein product [Anisakis simplex]|uniref:histone acetyltransferase n=1 Tax=Anisakis simplex TaxID=6269 RepID=A0A0M3K4K3_ANISI|nr:unnamed protein product [Anisakis simplex]
MVNASVAGDGKDKQEERSLIHACHCRDVNCRHGSCHEMKRKLQHSRVCLKRQSASCPACKQLTELCRYHAKRCSDTACEVPFCLNNRQNLQGQQRSQSLSADNPMDILSAADCGGDAPGTVPESGGVSSVHQHMEMS